MAASLLVLEIYKIIVCSFFKKKKIIIIIIESGVLNLDLLHQMKNKAKDLQAYWVILTEKVQVTYLKIFFLFF